MTQGLELVKKKVKSRFSPVVKKDFSEADLEQCYALAKIGITQEQMAAYWQVSLNTFKRRMETNEDLRMAVKRGRSDFQIKILRKVYELAEEKNPTILIWLTKARCGWSDRGPRIDAFSKLDAE